MKNILAQIWAILVSNYTVFIKFVGAILSKSRKMIIDCRLNSLLEKCLETQLVKFRWPDVLGLTLKLSMGFFGNYFTTLFLFFTVSFQSFVFCNTSQSKLYTYMYCVLSAKNSKKQKLTVCKPDAGLSKSKKGGQN